MLYSAADRVYDEVKELILTCELPGGELISEGEIAERYEVSRTPVREAFLRLAAEGWMRLYPKRGALIVPIGDGEARDLLDARVLIEAHAVSALAGRDAARAELVAALRENIDRHRAADPANAAEFAHLDAEFHQLIVAASDNAILSAMYVSLGERQRRMTANRLHRDAAVVELIHTDHSALADSVAAGDPAAFRALLVDHLSGVHQVPGASR